MPPRLSFGISTPPGVFKASEPIFLAESFFDVFGWLVSPDISYYDLPIPGPSITPLPPSGIDDLGVEISAPNLKKFLLFGVIPLLVADNKPV